MLPSRLCRLDTIAERYDLAPHAGARNTKTLQPGRSENALEVMLKVPLLYSYVVDGEVMPPRSRGLKWTKLAPSMSVTT